MDALIPPHNPDLPPIIRSVILLECTSVPTVRLPILSLTLRLSLPLLLLLLLLHSVLLIWSVLYSVVVHIHMSHLGSH